MGERVRKGARRGGKKGSNPHPLITAQGPTCAQVQTSATPGIPPNYGPKPRIHPRSKHLKRKLTTLTFGGIEISAQTPGSEATTLTPHRCAVDREGLDGI